MNAPSSHRDADLLASALEIDPAALRPIGREPLGDGAVAGFEVDHPDDQGGTRTSVAYVDTSGTAVAQETGLVLEGVCRVWTHPADPHLPALAPTAFGGALGVLLGRLGIEATGAPSFVAYRPGRRAVLRVPAASGEAWVKVVRPKRVSRIVDAHRALEEAGLPVPRVRGWSPDGVIVLDRAAGEPAIGADWRPDALLDAVDELRRALGEVRVDWRTRTAMPARLGWYADGARDAMPHEEERLARIVLACEEGLRAPIGEERTIHGDLHLGQLFVSGGPGSATDAGPRIAGLIDVDTLGRGDPAEDAGAFVSHAIASALLTQEGPARERMHALAAAARERWAGPRTDALTAIQLLGHVVAAATAGDPLRAGELLGVAEAIATGADRT